MRIQFTLNGQEIVVEAPGTLTLLRLLRDQLGLTGAKPGCEIGECGACSVLLDDLVVNACQLLAPQVHGRQVTTIEGIHGPGGSPTDMQRAFLDHGAVQCGYCTPGMVIAAEALLAINPTPSRDEIRQGISGNLCRCTGYQQIVDAVEATAAFRLEHRDKVKP